MIQLIPGFLACGVGASRDRESRLSQMAATANVHHKMERTSTTVVLETPSMLRLVQVQADQASVAGVSVSTMISFVVLLILPICNSISIFPTLSRFSLKAPLTSTLSAHLTEPMDSNFGRKDYWNEIYAASARNSSFSWYSEWKDLAPLVQELIPSRKSRILIPGVGNDSLLRDMYDAGYTNLVAFDYAPDGVACALDQIQDRLVEIIVADARDLTAVFPNDSFHAVLDKGTLDAIYLSGGKSNKALGATHLSWAVREFRRVVKPGGVIVSLSAACADAVRLAWEVPQETYLNNGDEQWTCVRDGSIYVTEDGYASNNVDGMLFAWRRKEVLL